METATNAPKTPSVRVQPPRQSPPIPPQNRPVGDAHERDEDGWRRGRPVEDPEKTKRWGVITAKPSEYLIHMRRGKIRRRSTGQGASCFKWPWDSVSIIPTTINRLHFAADQVTRECVGVEVIGLAVYRIVEPEIAFRMLNFSYAERASEKLAEIMREMFIGAVRRHVANLNVEDVLTRRKEAIASELLAELQPVVQGRGRAEDTTHTGWGVVLDSVEIQDVKILSDAVFKDMQAAYRAELAMRARRAELQSAQEIAAREATSAREIEEAKITADVAIREMKAQAESRSTTIEIAEHSKRAALKATAAAEQAAREHSHQVSDVRAKAELLAERARQDEAARLAAIDREQRLAEAERALNEARHAAALRDAELAALRRQQQQAADAQLREAESLAQDQLRRREIELDRLTHDLNAVAARAQRELDNLISDERIRLTMIEQGLPALASAFAQKIGEVRMTNIGGDVTDPAALVTRGIAQVLELARGLGLGHTKPSAP
jgi:flotillin